MTSLNTRDQPAALSPSPHTSTAASTRLPFERMVTPAIRRALVVERTEGRIDEYGPAMLAEYAAHGKVPGGCSWMSETIARVYGWHENGGCYVTPEGHIAHMWNDLPGGLILDATADQFGEPGDGIRVVPGDDPRYDATCDCEDQIG